MTTKQILENFPLRLALTNYCNSNCLFCSNEGMPSEYKNNQFAEINSLEWLLKTLIDNGLRSVALTGGEPTLYPDIDRIIRILDDSRVTTKFFHTNGILLNDKIIKILSRSKFTKIAVSVHSFNYKTWKKITGLNQIFFSKQTESLLTLSGKPFVVEVKHVLVSGINDSEKEIKHTLEVCNKQGFKVKFLNVEPISRDQLNFKRSISKAIAKIDKLGAKDISQVKEFRGQYNYLPITRFTYKNISGVAIDLMCGKKIGCLNCYNSNEMFLTPKLTLKPCHMSPYEIDISQCIQNKDTMCLLQRYKKARDYLKTAPGLNKKYWEQI